QQRDTDQSNQDGKTQRSIHGAAPTLKFAHDLRGKPLHTFPDHALNLLDDDAVDLVRDVVETIGHLLEMVVDLDAHDEVHRIAVAMLEEQLLQSDVMEIVDAALELGQLLGDRGQHGNVRADRLHQRQGAANHIG